MSTILTLALLLAFIPGVTLTATALTEGDWEYTVENGKATITLYSGSEGAVTIPSTLGGYPVTAIGGASAFGWRHSVTSLIKSVTIPNGVTVIGENAFVGCSNLTSVTIPDSVTAIGKDAFTYCTSLTSITIPDSVIYMSERAFNGTDNPRIIENLPNITFRCSENSYTHLYAKDFGFKFELIKPPSPLDSAAPWARPHIEGGLAKGFIPADVQNNYSNVITRSEFCRMAVKWVEVALGKPVADIVAERGVPERMNRTFSDTTDASILAAYRLGITAGSVAPADGSPGQFNPGGQFTRQEAAVMIMSTCKAVGADVADSPTADFADINAPETAGWARPGINFVRANGIMSGSDGNFNPAFTYTRQESITTFNNIKELPGFTFPAITPNPAPDPSPAPGPKPGSPYISIERTTFIPREWVYVKVGGVTAEMIANGAVVWHSTEGGSGARDIMENDEEIGRAQSFRAPDTPGMYEIRLYSSRDRDLSTILMSIRFTVVYTEPTDYSSYASYITLDKTIYSPGETIAVRVEGVTDDMIENFGTVYCSGRSVPIAFGFIESDKAGVTNYFIAPETPGEYEMSLYGSEDRYVSLIMSVSFTVQ